MLVIILFAWWEWRIENPILDIKLFAANRVFTFSNLAALANYSATYAVSFLLSLYLQYVKGLNPQTAGLILVSQPIVMAVFSPLAGRLSDRIDPRILASTGMAIVVVGLIPLIFLEMHTSLTFIVCSLIVLGFGFALFSSPNVNAIMSSVQKNFYGVASATLATMRLTGQLLSMGIVMSLLSTNLGKASIAPENYQNFLAGNKTTFIISAAICFGGIFASLARGKSGHVPEETMIK
jgi:MFS family permease